MGKRLQRLSWKKICHPVMENGLGVRSLHDTWKALTIKLRWSSRTKDSLWSKFIESRNIVKCIHPLCSTIGSITSSTWKNMLAVKDIAQEHITVRLIGGSSSLWIDN
ncbi:hypothetical protein ACH5RR_039260 [Cinchona calisaya]|uniref:Uncharacterized protein n=1 Tax=Cinchona calisaya TaxID=153742 RepID=A0ABD2Y161_9GENT